MSYAEFISRKLSLVPPTGISGELRIPDSLFDHQRALVQWALRRGRAAIFADTGLGKSRMQLVWASEVLRHTGRHVLILAPLAVAAQTVGEGAEIGIDVIHVRDQSGVTGPAIYITNYDRLHLFDADAFGALVLDESSCIKHHSTKTFAYLCEAFRTTQFKLCATATPAPNDWTELGTHAEFLGICTRAEMLAEYFIHDGAETQVWRLKGHARAQFWRWVSTWGAMVRKPSDLGFDDSRYELPPIQYFEHTVKSDGPLNGMLFAMEAQTLSERRDARRQSIGVRVFRAAEVIKESWINSRSQNTTACIAQQTLTDSSKSERGDTTKTQSQSESEQGSTPQSQSAPKLSMRRAKSTGTQTQKSVESTCGSATQKSESNSSQRAKSVDHAQSKAGLSEIGPCEQSSESALSSMSQCLIGKAEDAQSAALSDQAMEQGLRLTIATQPEKSEDSCAPHATQGSGGSRMSQRDSAGPQNIWMDQWVVWVELNAEQDAIAALFGKDCVSIYGSLTPEEKVARYALFKSGAARVLVTKPSIFGYGVNMQFSCRCAFVGVTDSFEAFYQTIRRQWRFGQQRPVQVHIFASDLEGAVVANLRRKEADALAMAESLSAETREAVIREVVGLKRETNIYNAARRITVPSWLKTEAE